MRMQQEMRDMDLVDRFYSCGKKRTFLEMEIGQRVKAKIDKRTFLDLEKQSRILNF